ncbi:hypothetical protein EH223_01315 [candidate division KSB1 bacterium]|nr:hypothetical protein [candidate division KSB1 bacterium]RQW06841.1 MAG: hypothetical protein EH223_01315 [candidate division KSB1 bacterium]
MMVANSNQQRKKRLFLLAGVAFLIIIVLAVYFLRFIGLDYDEVSLQSFAIEDALVIPPRPGTQSIVISGPEIREQFFGIDLSAPGIRPLVWQELEALEQTTWVTIRAQVLENGQLSFSKANNDVKDAGQSAPSLYIQNVLRTWTYFPNKTGTILFYFHVGAVGKKVTIDVSGLKKSPGISAKIPVVDRGLHYIKGLNASEIVKGKVDF